MVATSMINLIKSENLKLKRTMTRKIIWLLPLLVMLISTFMMHGYVLINGFSWMQTLFVYALTGLIAGLAEEQEEKRTQYKWLLSSNVPMAKIWLAKNIVLAGYFAMAMFSYLLLLYIGAVFIYIIFGAHQLIDISFGRTVLAASLIWLTNVWQIPFCQWLISKVKLVGMLMIQIIMGAGTLVFFAANNYWWLSPWTWGVRVLSPVLGVHPNGTILPIDSPLRNTNVLPIAVVLSLIFMVVIYLIIKKWFIRKEA